MIKKTIICLLDGICSVINIMNMKTVYSGKTVQNNTKLASYICCDYSYLTGNTNIRNKKWKGQGEI